jgi:hypothetical protein
MDRQIDALDRQSIVAAQLKLSPAAEVTISPQTLTRIGVSILLVALAIIVVIWVLFWRVN